MRSDSTFRCSLQTRSKHKTPNLVYLILRLGLLMSCTRSWEEAFQNKRVEYFQCILSIWKTHSKSLGLLSLMLLSLQPKDCWSFSTFLKDFSPTTAALQAIVHYQEPHRDLMSYLILGIVCYSSKPYTCRLNAEIALYTYIDGITSTPFSLTVERVYQTPIWTVTNSTNSHNPLQIHMLFVNNNNWSFLFSFTWCIA